MIEGATAIAIASMLGHLDIVKLLLDSSADPTIRNRQGLDALTLAHRWGHCAIVAALDAHEPVITI